MMLTPFHSLDLTMKFKQQSSEAVVLKQLNQTAFKYYPNFLELIKNMSDCHILLSAPYFPQQDRIMLKFHLDKTG